MTVVGKRYVNTKLLANLVGLAQDHFEHGAIDWIVLPVDERGADDGSTIGIFLRPILSKPIDPPLALLVDILSPSQSIAQGYETYTIERANGRTEAGTLAEQTATAITLRQAGQPLVIPRRDIKHIAMLPQSSMPADLDKVIPPQEMADLLAFLTRR